MLTLNEYMGKNELKQTNLMYCTSLPTPDLLAAVRTGRVRLRSEGSESEESKE